MIEGHFCLPIQEGSLEDAERAIAASTDLYSRFELWLDCLSGWDEETLQQIISRYPGQLIFLFRRPGLEPIKLPLSRRCEVIDALRDSEALFDFDVRAQQDELKHLAAHPRRCHLIASYHDYEETPSDLSSVIQEMEQWEPDIYKVAAYCRSRVDAVSLLSLLVVLQTSGKQAVVLGMGEHGKITRVFGALWGNALHFAPIEKEKASAAGQLTRKELQSAIDLLA